MTLDNAILLLAILLSVFLLVALVQKRAYRSAPTFFTYQGWCLISTTAFVWAVSLPPADYLRVYTVNIALDALFHFAVLVELGRTVAHYNRANAPRWAFIALLLLPAVLLLRSLSSWSTPFGVSEFGVFFVRLQQSLPILLLAFLLALVWWSRLQSFDWPDFALHVASGLGFYFIVCLLVAVIHTHQTEGVSYHWADVAQSGSYLAVLSYWLLKLS